ncbi:PH domain-containing protein [Arenimonas alkanexedens]
MNDTPLPSAWTTTQGWQPLPPAAITVATIGGSLVAIPFCFAAGAVGIAFLDGWLARVGAGLALFLVVAVLGALLGRARARRTQWQLDARGLQVRRGLIWKHELLVPRSRVQHLDIERGPIERRAGLATLVVHTAGTRMHALRQPGLRDADAMALRDALLPEADRDDDSL